MWSLSNVWFMNFSVKYLTGHLSLEIGKFMNLQMLDLSYNQLSASIPQMLSNLKMLQQLNLSNNAFQGNIPTSIGDLASLESLDLSSNNLSGIIPKSLEKLHYLTYLNLSFNMLNGPVPITGTFANFTLQSFMGNPNLCGNSKLKPKHNSFKIKKGNVLAQIYYFSNCCCNTCGIIDNYVYQKEKQQESTIL
ncbi:hypothetical protein FEM48_Zijuj07G0159200 [Ziziphus jujuba var. spinosa]|uniref:Non-specific serine/threonine protein kinase n=1 Tax=Ziziphus jujuba var. spinosa TaxID=714518 RepID=A0A978V5J7_ZIZJJ|nr:hypothetical protein FEM48_Zijuj07G0159200 [Ziziphus jujuba var. spinosa]